MLHEYQEKGEGLPPETLATPLRASGAGTEFDVGATLRRTGQPLPEAECCATQRASNGGVGARYPCRTKRSSNSTHSFRLRPAISSLRSMSSQDRAPRVGHWRSWSTKS